MREPCGVSASKMKDKFNCSECTQLLPFRKDARDNIGTNSRDIFAIFPKLAERKHQKAGTLSGGERQMLAIARGLMSEPKLLMLDEPSLGLAPIIKQQIFNTIKRLKGRFSTMLVEQEILGALNVSDRAIFLREGRIILERFSSELLKDRQTIRKLIEV